MCYIESQALAKCLVLHLNAFVRERESGSMGEYVLCLSCEFVCVMQQIAEGGGEWVLPAH